MNIYAFCRGAIIEKEMIIYGTDACFFCVQAREAYRRREAYKVIFHTLRVPCNMQFMSRWWM